MPFADRQDAGRRLARALDRYRDEKPVILALPRGGVPVAGEIAEALEAPLDLVLVRKIGVPDQPELAMGAVVNGAEPLTVRNEDVIRLTRTSDAEFAEVRDRELAEIGRRRKHYLGDRPHPSLTGRTAIVTGANSGIEIGRSHCPIQANVAPRCKRGESVSDAGWADVHIACAGYDPLHAARDVWTSKLRYRARCKHGIR